MDAEALYELLKVRDEEIAALRKLVDAMVYEFAELYAEDRKGAAHDAAVSTLRDLYEQCGFKSDGRFRT